MSPKGYQRLFFICPKSREVTVIRQSLTYIRGFMKNIVEYRELRVFFLKKIVVTCFKTKV